MQKKKWGCSSVWLERPPVTRKAASSSLVIPAKQRSIMVDKKLVKYKVLTTLSDLSKPIEMELYFNEKDLWKFMEYIHALEWEVLESNLVAMTDEHYTLALNDAYGKGCEEGRMYECEHGIESGIANS